MFNEQDLFKFKLFIVKSIVNNTLIYQHRYVFLENHDEIVTLHGIPYEPPPFANAVGQDISIWYSSEANYPNLMIIGLLQNLINFNPLFDKKNVRQIALTFLDQYDMNAVPWTSATTADSLAPTITVADQIYISDLSMKSSSTYFLDQFAPMLWISFVGSFLLCALILNFGSWYLRKYISVTLNGFSWFSIITQQGGDETSKFIFRNIIFVTIGMLTIIFHGSFEAFLSSSLAIRLFDIPFSDLNGLIKATDYTICTIPHTAAYDYMTNQQLASRHNTAKCPNYFRQFSAISKSSESKLTRCPEGKFAYMGFGMDWGIDWNEKCNFLPLMAKYFTQYISINVSPGFKYREHFNRGIIRLRNGGHLQCLVEFHAQYSYFTMGLKYGRYKHIDKHDNVEQLSVDILQVFIVLLIPLAGLIGASFVLGVEALIHFSYNSRNH